MRRLQRSYRAIPSGALVRLAKPTSNLFRMRGHGGAPGLDVSGLGGVLHVDPDRRIADVGGMCRYADLVAATLPHGLTPLVVPQLKTITLGGAVAGLGIESASFRNGLPHESVLELDVLIGTGEVVTTGPGDELNSDLFRCFPNSYGTLGYATRLRIELEPVAPKVALRHVRFEDLRELCDAVGQIMAQRSFDGERVDYLDGVVFSPTESYLTLGTSTRDGGPTSDYTGSQIYYRSIRRRSHDLLTAHDYLWRWDTDWFWCSRALGAQHPVLRRLWPARLRRSDVYHKLVRLDRRLRISERISGPQETVVQDVEIPLERTPEFLDWFGSHVPIEPLWLCPVRLRGDHRWPLYPLEPGRDYVNVGFWGGVAIAPGATDGAVNREIEAVVSRAGGHKSLYSDSYYSRSEFDTRYGGTAYAAVKDRYDPDRRLLDLYEKTVRRR